MTDYIEREAVLEEIKEFAELFCECDYVFPPMVRYIKRIPAADVRPAVEIDAAVDDALAVLDAINNAGRLDYADYSHLHDAISGDNGIGGVTR